MFDGILFEVSARLVTYLIHSTLWLGGAWLLTRFLRAPSVREWTWRAAVAGGLVTALLHGRFGVDAPLAVALPEPVATTPAPTAPSSTVSVALESPARSKLDGAAPAAAGASLRWYHGVALLWALGAIVGLGHLAAQHVRLRRELATRREMDDPALAERLAHLRAEAGFDRPVRLTACAGLGSPIAVGASEICLPERALSELSPGEQTSMLAHELAHLARRDPTWLGAQVALERLLFFQPLNRLAARRLEEAAELLCDEQAVRWTGERAALARCLGRVAQWGARAHPLAAGMVRRASPLVHRVERVLSGGGERPSRAQAVLAVAWTAAAAGVLACQGPGLSGRKGPPADDHPPQVAFVDERPREMSVMVPVAVRGRPDEWVTLDSEIESIEAAWQQLDAEINKLVTDVTSEHGGEFSPDAFEPRLRAWINARIEEDVRGVPSGHALRVLNGKLLIGDDGVTWGHRETGTLTSGLRVTPASKGRPAGTGVATVRFDHPPTILDVLADGSVKATIQAPVEGTPGATMATGVQLERGDDFAERVRRVLKLAADGMPKCLLEGDESTLEVPAGRVVLRVDRAADFDVVLVILEACAAPEVQIWNVSFELPVAPDADEEFATPLPRDAAPADGESPPSIEVRIEVSVAGEKVDLTTGGPWSGHGPFRFEGRRLIYSVSSQVAPGRTLGTAVGSSKGAAAALAQKRAEHPGAVVRIDARPGVVFEDVAPIVTAARELELPVRFVGHRSDK